MQAGARDISSVRHAIDQLPGEWHGAGTVSGPVLDAIMNIAPPGTIGRSVETGTGRTTLLLSHLSRDHVVFTKDDAGDGDSLSAVRSSELLNAETVSFVIGPTQRTILNHEFQGPIEVAYLDGPHAYPFPELEYWAVYPHIPTGGLLIVDDLQIPTIANMFAMLKADRMWDLDRVVDNTAFLRRTAAPGIDPYGEGWWEQDYNTTPSHAHLPPQRRARAIARVTVDRLGALRRRAR